LTRPSGSGNLAQNSTGNGNSVFALRVIQTPKESIPIGIFELVRRSGERRRLGVKIALQVQPFSFCWKKLQDVVLGKVLHRRSLTSDRRGKEAVAKFEKSVAALRS
jgi:hypothetical protein